MRAKLSIVAVIVLGLLTGLCFYLVKDNVETKVRTRVEKRLKGHFGTAWNLVEADAHEAVRSTAHITAKYRNEFNTFVDDQVQLQNALERKIKALPPEKQPDAALVVVKGRVLASHMPKEYLPKASAEKLNPGLTNRAVEIDVSRKVFTHELKKKAGVPASALVPAGWVKPKVFVGSIKKSKNFAKGLPTAAAAPIVLVFDGNNRLSTKGTPKRLGALVLAWKSKRSATEVRETAETVAGDSELRNKHFWGAYKSDRGRLRGILLMAEKVLTAEGRPPAFLMLVDSKGVVLHRNRQSRYLVGESLGERYLSLNTVLTTGLPQSDIWTSKELASMGEKKSKKDQGKGEGEDSLRSTLIRVGMAAINGDGGKVVGGVCAGWSLSDKKATEIGKNLGTGVVFLEGDDYAASSKGLSSVSKATIKKLKSNRVEAKKYDKVDGTVEFEGLKPTLVTVGGKRYLGASGIMAGARRVGAHSFLVLVPLDDAKEPFKLVSWIVLVLGGFAIVIVLLMIFFMSRHFLKPIDEIYSGVNEMLAGDLDYSFGVPSRETEGLCYALNGLLAKLLGRPEPEDEEDAVEDSDGPEKITVAMGPLPDQPTGAADDSVAELVKEDDEAHYRRIYSAYVEAMEEYGDDTSAFTYEDFKQLIDVNLRMIKSRFECEMVRFKRTSDSEGAPRLDPIPIKK